MNRKDRQLLYMWVSLFIFTGIISVKALSASNEKLLYQVPYNVSSIGI